MLRFVSRSSNEYESFAHLLKITPVNEINFEPIQVRNILNMLNDVEDNQEQQEKIIKQMVKNQFSDVKILSKIDSNDKFTIKADSMIAKEIKNLYEKDIQEIKISAIDIIKEKDRHIGKTEENSSRKEEDLSKVANELEFLKKENKDKEISKNEAINNFKKHLKSFIFWIIPLFLLLIVCVIAKPFCIELFNLKNESIGTGVIIPIISALLGLPILYIKKLIIPKFKDLSDSCSKLKNFIV